MSIFNRIKPLFKSNTSSAQSIKNDEYDFYTIEGIRSIPIPKYEPLDGLSSPVNNLEYILQRKATEHKKGGRMDLAIECLKKSNEIMPHSNFTYSEKDYMRLVEFLKHDGQFDRAREEERAIKDNLPPGNEKINKVLRNTEAYKTDLLLASTNYLVCEICSKYQGRVYSISGNDERFPKLPDIVLETGGFHEDGGCGHLFYPFDYDFNVMNIPIYNGNSMSTITVDPIEYSNRPFVDERSEEVKEQYDKKIREHNEKIRDRKNYALLCEHLPSHAPKSFGGYRRMKNSTSKNFEKLVALAKEVNIDLR